MRTFLAPPKRASATSLVHNGIQSDSSMSATASCLEVVPSELLDTVLAELSDGDLATLMRCNKSMNRRVEPQLYGRQHRCDLALIWASANGFVPTIRQAIRYGASINHPIAEVTGGVPAGSRFPLYLALKNSHARCFKCLLELGAGIEGAELDILELRTFLKRLCAPRNNHQLRAFFELTVASQNKRLNVVADGCLSLVLSSNEPLLETVQFLLDHGADPRRLQAATTRCLAPLLLRSWQTRSSLPAAS